MTDTQLIAGFENKATNKKWIVLKSLILKKKDEIKIEKWKPVSQELVESDNEFFFIWGYVASLDIRSEIIQPSKSATFSTSFQTCMHVSVYYLKAKL